MSNLRKAAIAAWIAMSATSLLGIIIGAELPKASMPELLTWVGMYVFSWVVAFSREKSA